MKGGYDKFGNDVMEILKSKSKLTKEELNSLPKTHSCCVKMWNKCNKNEITHEQFKEHCSKHYIGHNDIQECDDSTFCPRNKKSECVCRPDLVGGKLVSSKKLETLKQKEQKIKEQLKDIQGKLRQETRLLKSKQK